MTLRSRPLAAIVVFGLCQACTRTLHPMAVRPQPNPQSGSGELLPVSGGSERVYVAPAPTVSAQELQLRGLEELPSGFWRVDLGMSAPACERWSGGGGPTGYLVAKGQVVASCVDASGCAVSCDVAERQDAKALGRGVQPAVGP